MQHDDEPPKYRGSFVTMRADGLDYIVAIEPPITGCDCEPRSFPCKQSAWLDAQCRWTMHRLPFKNFCDAGVGFNKSHEAAVARKLAAEKIRRN